jgi:hypothetical protein
MALKNRKGVVIIIIAAVVILLGVIGCVFSIGGSISVKNFKLDLPETTRLASAIGGGLDTSTTTIENLSAALKNGSKTVREAKDSLYNVRDILNNTATAVKSIADAMDFSIFGFQPLLGASEYFGKVGTSIGELEDKIIDIADNIDVNAADVEKIADNLEDLSLKLKDISSNFNSSIFTLPDFGFKRMLYVMLALVGALSLAFILVGTGLILINKSISLLLVKS